MIIKRLTECSIDTMVEAWNKGFEGYFVPMNMTPDTFLNRLVSEGLSPELSLVAFAKEEPVGIVLNGFRTVNGKKTAWNGGTGVSPNFRGKGVSKLLMEENLRLYENENVEIATLEAIKENERAIRLYQKNHYKISDELLFLNGNIQLEPADSDVIKSVSVRPELLPHYSFYKEDAPWQCQWQSLSKGEAKIFYGNNNLPVGYALYRRVWNMDGQLNQVLLYQLEILEESHLDYLPFIFSQISDGEVVDFRTINFSSINPVTKYLLENGFKISTEQVQMIRIM
ncbi:GNAT family N-acetyltransferase [Bacillus massilinigeriensis]|uniref:GNAT family N-acetyltransferase n=1 Tax=Bacillus massilionigeriensis TaxID=1805475 RepID=UPI00096B2792|nr:GNAT family N-acetyltransferase [Bacillus massilionigeriensis]